MKYRKITIQIELSEQDTDDYAGVCSELVIEDFVNTTASIKIISDNNPPEETA